MRDFSKIILWIGLAVLLAGIGYRGYQMLSGKDVDVEVQETSAMFESVEDIPEVSEEVNSQAQVAAGEYRYMEKFSGEGDPNFDLENAAEWFYLSKHEDFEDSAVRNLAAEYINKGYEITDARIIMDKTGAGVGFGDYGFVNGFEVADPNGDVGAVCAMVYKATREEFDLFAEEFFDGESYEEKSDGDMVVLESGSFTLTYRPDDEILIYDIDLSAGSVG